MFKTIIGKMKRGVYYPGHHLGKREDIDQLVAQGYLERMDASFLCGSDSQPVFCLTDKGCLVKKKITHMAPCDETER